MPQRPQVLKGSQAEFDWAKSCINLLEEWRHSLKKQGQNLAVSDLNLQVKYDFCSLVRIWGAMENRLKKQFHLT